MMRALPLWLFAAAAVLPAACLVAGMIWGGLAAWAGLAAITVFAAGMDRLAPAFMGDAQDGAEFPAEGSLLIVLALLHILLMPFLGAHIAGDAPLTERLGLFLGASLWLGQIGNPVAHELIHRSPRALFGLGVTMFSMVLFGHHTSAHRLVHHVHAATPNDPNSARSGEGFYAFFLRAWGGSFLRGYAAETRRRAHKSGKAGLHSYAIYLGISGLCLIYAAATAGLAGAAIWLALSISAQAQLMLSDYVQHYGLTRAKRADGTYEPVRNRHSWNAPFWYSSAMMVNAPRHSDHHTNPARAYPALRLPSVQDAPRLPWPLPLACSIALIPPLWKRAIRPHLKPWLVP